MIKDNVTELKMKKVETKEDKSLSRQRIIEEFGRHLRMIRTELKINQKEMALKLEVSPSYISEIESGKTGPGFEFMYKLGLNYDINPLFLLYGKEPKLLPKQKKEPVPETGPSLPPNERNDPIGVMIYYMKRSDLIMRAMLESLKLYRYKNKDYIAQELQEYERKQNKQTPGT